MTTDWGVRTLDTRHPFYEPLHYNNGAVWPFVTGFASWAHYRAGRGWAGFDLLRDIAQTGDDFALGVQPELMSGAFYRPLDTAMPDQFFSTSMIVSPLLRGLLGYGVHARSCAVTLAPQLPAQWDSLTVRRLPAGCGSTVSVTLRRAAGVLLVELRREGPSDSARPRPITVTLAPRLPLGARAERALATVTLATSARAEFRFTGGAELVPADVRPRVGDPVRGPRLTDWQLEGGRYVATIEGNGTQRFRVRSGVPLRMVEGARAVGRTGEMHEFEVTLPAAGGRARVVLAP